MAINLALFVWVARNFEYKQLAKPRVAAPKPRGPPPSWVRPRVVEGVVRAPLPPLCGDWAEGHARHSSCCLPACLPACMPACMHCVPSKLTPCSSCRVPVLHVKALSLFCGISMVLRLLRDRKKTTGVLTVVQCRSPLSNAQESQLAL